MILYSDVTVLIKCVPCHDASSSCGWKIRPSDVEGNCEYTK